MRARRFGGTVNLKDKVVLITGAAQGIGRATARQFAEEGARVVIHYKSNREEAERTAASLKGDSHKVLQADITDADQARKLIENVVRDSGRLDVLVNNAAIFELHPIAKISYDEWRQAWQNTINTNLIGTANLTFCAAQQMIKQNGERGRGQSKGQVGGKIINVSSREPSA